MDIIADRVDKIACRKCGQHLDVSGLQPFSMVECPDCNTRQTVPMQFGNFLLLEVFGKGGMGAVYRALDQSLGRYVAIKVLRENMAQDGSAIEGFLREARAAAALNHPNIVQIYSCGEFRSQPYIIMELVAGGKLDAMIADGNPMDEVRALEIGIDVAEGLKAANEIGLIHGDIKPANILFDGHNTGKVVDFGLARFVNWSQDEPGEIWGTPYYIAPEKARGQRVDHRSDIYSLGATLYHALGAKPPFDGKTASDVVLARLKNPAIGLRVIRPSLQPETADVIARMLESDPFMRYPTYASLLADMREALRVAKQENRSLHTKVKKSAAGPLILVGVGLLVLLALFAGGLQMSRKPRNKTTVRNSAEGVEAEVVVTEEAAVEKPDVPVIPKIQPFAPAAEQAIVDSAQRLAQGSTLSMEETLQGIYNQMPAGGVGRCWINMLQAVPCWYDGREDAARLYMQEILDTRFEVVAGGEPHPAVLIKTLSRYMLNERDEGVVYIEAARWPAWVRDIVEFYVGLNNLRNQQMAQADAHLQTYVDAEEKDVVWPYAMKPVAQMWLAQYREFNDVKQKVDRDLSLNATEPAREALQDLRARTSAFFYPAIDELIGYISDQEQKLAAEQRQREMLANQELVQADLDRVDELQTENLPLVAQKDYRKAAASISKLMPDMKTSEGLASLHILRESYERMDDIKKYLIKAVEKAPYKSSELGGKATGANLTGIHLQLGGHGMMTKPWKRISIRVMLQMTSYYLAKDKKMPSKDRADKLMSLAVLCYQNGGFKPASKYAQKAVDEMPSVSDEVRRLMPNILE